ncbi:MAG: hypothetical protein OEY14_06355, partial [Myxococcales bacterium]|nr:hypothetical protein [Myxococcales bacterium]
MSSRRFAPLLLSLALGLSLSSCGGEATAPDPSASSGAEVAALSGVLFDSEGSLEPGDGLVEGRHLDRYELEVQAGTRLMVELNSSAFDPVLEVITPGSAMLVNDDWQGNLTHSRLDFIV